MAWLWWMGLTLVLGVIEVLTVELTFLMLAGGAAAAGIAGALGAPLWAQILIGVMVSSVLLLLVRPMALAKLRARRPDELTNVAAHVGRTALVTEDVTQHEGRVKLAGEVWSARSETAGVLLAGMTVVVTKIDGATAVVAAQDEPLQSQLPYGQPNPGYPGR